ncbi:DUF4870 domain-containing protein [Pedobacter aquatilis]|uniref:DUF4870 domain-containing protein n=1 Tax=Pedobacter aquatilis TaxID=351343 RepID=UPI00292EFABB|nr:DUF4870 domain-containing protein [Pedobacter aquatilis]
MSNKTMAILAYVTIIGWVVAYLEYKKSTERNPLVNYHLGQALGLMILTFVLAIALTVVSFIVPTLSFLSLILSGLSIVFLLLGVVAANNEVIKPLPLVGKLFEGKFNFAS